MIDPTPGGTVVYVLGLKGMDPVKIGVSRNLPERIRSLQTGAPAQLEILWTTPGGQSLETRLHSAFQRYRTHGEWFNLAQLGDPVTIVREAVRAIHGGEPASIPVGAQRCLPSAASGSDDWDPDWWRHRFPGSRTYSLDSPWGDD
ncbi:GIY-YIG nuclease family protein [Streptomyces zhihengii]|uniref:GIY-YIG nuclease family protein n=1 Tax=Streptomyces zhihengii TaxID=1818004 RepID=A0ABS2UZD0_9ACTN|nr:GIY-YIG nuclease family protein [Streptomyces zhihengii]MBM9622242.1 GIY-YIG nuclease family protein [Streptomyces zhihengii]